MLNSQDKFNVTSFWTSSNMNASGERHNWCELLRKWSCISGSDKKINETVSHTMKWCKCMSMALFAIHTFHRID